MKPVLYGIPNCDTVKKARAWLNERAVDYAFHDYKREGIEAAKLRSWSKALGWDRILNRNGITFRKLPDVSKQNLDEDKAIALMIGQPSMIRRPILEVGNHLAAGFDADRFEAMLRSDGPIR